MTKKSTKNKIPKVTPRRRAASAIRAFTEPRLAPAEAVKLLIREFRKQQRQVIALADPVLSRFTLPAIITYLSLLEGHPTMDDVSKASAILAYIEWMIEKT